MAFIIGFVVFFLIIALTLILGGVSRAEDRRVEREGRATKAQRRPDEQNPVYP
jgi:hypothetical protein